MAKSVGDGYAQQQGEIDALRQRLSEAKEKAVEKAAHVVTDEEKFDRIRAELRLKFYHLGFQRKALLTTSGSLRVLASRHKLSLTSANVDRLIQMHREEYLATRERVTWQVWLGEFTVKYWNHLCAAWWLVVSFLSAVLSPIAAVLGCLVCFVRLPWLVSGVLFDRINDWRTGGGTDEGDDGSGEDPYIVDTCVVQDGDVDGGNNPPDIDTRSTFSPSESPVCNPKTIPLGFTIARDEIWIPRNCSCNAEVAVLYRQLLPALSTAHVRKMVWRNSLECFKRVLPPITYAYDEKEAVEMYREHLTPKLRNVYDKVVDFNDIEVHDCYSTSKAFVKVEVLTGKVSTKRHPRLISGKEDNYLAITGPGYYHFQKHITKEWWYAWGDKDDVVSELTKWSYLYPGSIGPVQLGWLVSYFEELGWFVYEGDFSRYDGHTEIEALEAEMELYEHLGVDAETIHQLRKQFKTVGKTGNGVKFTCTGKRASGVINTTMGNTLCGMMLFSSFFQGWDQSDYFVIQLGDDNLIFTKVEIDSNQLVRHCEKAGHKLELVERGNDRAAYDATEFCSSIFWDIGEHRVLGPKVARALAKSFQPHTRINVPIEHHIAGVARGYKHYNWVPVLGHYCTSVLKNYPNAPKILDDNPYKMRLDVPIDVDPAAVERFFIDRYNLDPADVVRIMDLLHVDISNYGRPRSISHSLLRQMLEVDGVTAEL
jgi:hypothetical protein